MRLSVRATLLLLLGLLLACHGPAEEATPPPLRVVAVETFLADIAQNVAGERLRVESLLPPGVEPHDYEPTPRDIARVAECDLLIVNGAGLEGFLERLLESAGGYARIVVASAGLAVEGAGGVDPHFWLDPNRVIRYVENIRDGLAQADPEGRERYAHNAEAYIAQLQALDRWIAGRVQEVPAGRRLLVTEHRVLGYFADRYGLRVVGTIVPGTSPEAAPSAQQLAQLVEDIRASGAPAIFLEAGENPQLARQIAAEAGIRVVSGLYTHSLSGPDGPAPTYIEMMRHNTRLIVEALK
ncbi:MAG: metal ABC transporter solute-binding protein, Zn/Mn family [Chloroflexia bacterium]